MSQIIEIKVPDIGDYKDVPVVEVLVKPGDKVEKEQSIVVLESDKATMDVPSSHAGVVREVKVKVGDNLSEGSVVIVLDGVSSGASAPAAPAPAASAAPAARPVEPPIARAPAPPPISNTPPPVDAAVSHASPSVRKFARELGVDLKMLRAAGDRSAADQSYENERT